MAESGAVVRHRLLDLAKLLACLGIACVGATTCFAYTYGTEFQGRSYFLTYLIVLLPFTAAISFLIGGPVFWVLRGLRVQRGIIPCILVGAMLGSLPGLAMLGVNIDHAPWLEAEARQYPLIFGAFGAIGGTLFWLAALATKFR